MSCTRIGRSFLSCHGGEARILVLTQSYFFTLFRFLVIFFAEKTFCRPAFQSEKYFFTVSMISVSSVSRGLFCVCTQFFSYSPFLVVLAYVAHRCASPVGGPPSGISFALTLDLAARIQVCSLGEPLSCYNRLSSWVRRTDAFSPLPSSREGFSFGYQPFDCSYPLYVMIFFFFSYSPFFFFLFLLFRSNAFVIFPLLTSLIESPVACFRMNDMGQMALLPIFCPQLSPPLLLLLLSLLVSSFLLLDGSLLFFSEPGRDGVLASRRFAHLAFSSGLPFHT